MGRSAEEWERQVRGVIEQHIVIASQYERVGDSGSAADLRRVANLLAPLLEGKETGTFWEPLTPENIDEHRRKNKEIDDAEKAFATEEARTYDDWEDELAYEEGANRTLLMLVRMPKDAHPTPFLDGIMQACRFWRRRFSSAKTSTEQTS